VVNLPARKEWPADVPPLALAVRGQDEGALPRTHQNAHSAHVSLLAESPELFVGEQFASLYSKLPIRSSAVAAYGLTALVPVQPRQLERRLPGVVPGRPRLEPHHLLAGPAAPGPRQGLAADEADRRLGADRAPPRRRHAPHPLADPLLGAGPPTAAAGP